MKLAATEAQDLIGAIAIGVLATMRADGRPQLSPVMPHYDRDAGRILISTQSEYAKARNVRARPWAALEVTSADGLSWATAEGPASVRGPGAGPYSPEGDALVDYFRAAAGEHSNWDDYRRVMFEERRVLITIAVSRVYGRRVSALD